MADALIIIMLAGNFQIRQFALPWCEQHISRSVVHDAGAAGASDLDLQKASGRGEFLNFLLAKLKGQLTCAHFTVTLQKDIINRGVGDGRHTSDAA